MDGSGFSILLAHTLSYSRKKVISSYSHKAKNKQRWISHFYKKITTALGISSVTLQFLQALFSPRLWIYTLLCSNENRFLELFISMCRVFTALGLESTTTGERCLRKATCLDTFVLDNKYVCILELWHDQLHGSPAHSWWWAWISWHGRGWAGSDCSGDHLFLLRINCTYSLAIL